MLRFARNNDFNYENHRGFTLVEVVAVILLLVLMGSLAASRLGSVTGYRQNGDIRRFVNTWQFLFSEASGRGEAYRLVIDLDDNSYFVQRELPVDEDESRKVDLVKNMRTKGEKERRQREEAENMLSVEEEFKKADERDANSLDVLFYDFLFHDSQGNVRPGVPTEFPNLADKRQLSNGVRFRDVQVLNDVITEGQIYFRFSPRGASDFAVVHLEAEDQVFTIVMNPATGEVKFKPGDLKFEWKMTAGGEDASF